jgi:hypothetical protein
MNYKTGEVFNKSIFFRFQQKQLTVKNEDELSAAVSLKPYCPKAGEQRYGTCYSYATAYSARTILFNITLNETQQTDAHIFSPGFIQKLMRKKRWRCKRQGASTHVACQKMAMIGVVKRVDYPMDCSGKAITQSLRSEALKFRVKIKRVVNPGMPNAEKTLLIKQSLAEKKPVVITVYTKKTSMLTNTNSDYWKPTPSDLSKANSRQSHHAMTIVGYDDNTYGGAYQVLNSYGEDWMDKGYFWIQYEDFNPFISSAIEMGNIST